MQRGSLFPGGSNAGSATLVQTPGLTPIPRMLPWQIESGPKVDIREMLQLEENFHWGISFSCGWMCKYCLIPLAPWISGRSAAKIQNPCSGCHEIPRVTIHTWALETVLKKGWRRVRETQNCCIKTDLVFWGPGSHKCNNSLCSVKW